MNAVHWIFLLIFGLFIALMFGIMNHGAQKEPLKFTVSNVHMQVPGADAKLSLKTVCANFYSGNMCGTKVIMNGHQVRMCWYTKEGKVTSLESCQHLDHGHIAKIDTL